MTRDRSPQCIGGGTVLLLQLLNNKWKNSFLGGQENLLSVTDDGKLEKSSPRAMELKAGNYSLVSTQQHEEEVKHRDMDLIASSSLTVVGIKEAGSS